MRQLNATRVNKKLVKVALFSYIAYFEKPLAPNDRHDVRGIMPPAMQRLDVARLQGGTCGQSPLFFFENYFRLRKNFH